MLSNLKEVRDYLIKYHKHNIDIGIIEYEFIEVSKDLTMIKVRYDKSTNGYHFGNRIPINQNNYILHIREKKINKILERCS